MPVPTVRYEGFIGPMRRFSSKIAGPEQTINFLVEYSTSRKEFTFIGRPGLLEVSATFSGGGPVGGLLAGDNRLFAVINSKLYEVFEFGGPPPVLFGDVGLSTGQATMLLNGNQLMVVNAGKVYIWTGTTLVEPDYTGGTDPVLGSTGTFLDGYFVIAQPNSKTWAWSNLNDGLTWDPLNTEQKEGYPDNISRIIAHDRRLWIFGFQTTEIWQNSGNPPPASPFSRVSFMEQGCAAPYSVAKVGPTSIMWLGTNAAGMGYILRADSVQPMRVSTHALEYEISTYGNINNAEAYAGYVRGHYLYTLTFPNPGITWTYDLTASEQLGEPVWTRYAGFDNGNYTRYRGRVQAFVQGWNNGAGRQILGDWENGQLWEERPTYYTDGPDAIKVERTAPLLLSEDNRVTVWRYELLMNVGENPTGDAEIISMEQSWDAGQTFGNSHEASAGAIGEYKKRVLWRQVGAGRRGVCRLSSTSPVPHTWTDMLVRSEVSNS